MREVAFELAPLPSDQLKLSGPAPDVMVEVLVMTNRLIGSGCTDSFIVKSAMGLVFTII